MMHDGTVEWKRFLLISGECLLHGESYHLTIFWHLFAYVDTTSSQSELPSFLAAVAYRKQSVARLQLCLTVNVYEAQSPYGTSYGLLQPLSVPQAM